MIPAIKSAAEHFGHLDGAAAAEQGIELFPDRAFERRLYASRLVEAERPEYERAYFEAFTARAAQLLSPGPRVVETGEVR